MANQAAACDTNFGGRITVNIGGVQYTPTDADIKIKPTNSEVDAEMNSDGSMSTRTKLMPFEADITFRNNSGIVWQSAMQQCSVNATIQEEDNGRLHLFTSARLVGRPEYNTATGEVTGVTIKGPNYQFVG